jgi:putative RNA 2'-phosphotransferase
MIPYEFSAERFSRWMAYVLRHNPERYGLQPDRHGFVGLEDFLRIAQHRYPDMTGERLHGLIASGGTARFEVAEGKVRARYGHSIPVEPLGPPVEPPPELFYGTDDARGEAALAGGLLPSDRRMLHLSVTREDAAAIARRKAEQPVILRILAREAAGAGTTFYREGAVYLTSSVPATYLRRESLPAEHPNAGG